MAAPVELTASASAESQGEFVLYTTDDGLTRVEMRADGGSLWLSQTEIATLFQTTPQNVTQHVKAIYAEGEADPEATCKSGLQVRQEGGRLVRRNVRFYSLDVILAVGYRARSARGTQFRQWATANLSEYLLKGFVMDDERLKNPPVGDSVLPPTRLQFMTVQWGNCSPSGRITLNPLLVKAPRECIDYVLLHELCHLLHHNHGPKFYRTLDRHMPNWRAVKEKLDNMAKEVFRA